MKGSTINGGEVKARVIVDPDERGAVALVYFRKQPSPWVTCYYVHGESDWRAARYFDNGHKARADFMERVRIGR